VGGHGITGNQDDNGRNEVTLRAAAAGTAEPHVRSSSIRLSSPLGAVLILSPSTAGVPPGLTMTSRLLTTTGTAQPILADKQENGQTDTVPDEGGAHDEMGFYLKLHLEKAGQARIRWIFVLAHGIVGKVMPVLRTDTVPDEGGAHDEMGQTLTEVIIATEAERGNAADAIAGRASRPRVLSQAAS
jgi:hypothetical protein